MAEQLNLPPQLARLFATYLGAIPEPPEDPTGGLLDLLHEEVLGARRDAGAAGLNFRQAGARQAPSTSPGQDAMVELLGGLSQVLAPDLGGLQAGRETRAGMERDAGKARLERLGIMERHYDQLAERADRLGNTELSLKMRAKAESFAAKQAKHKEALDLATRMYEGGQDRQLQRELNAADIASRQTIAKTNADASMNRILARNPGLTLDALGNVVPLRGIDDKTFNDSVIPLAREVAKGKGGGEAMNQFKAQFAQLKQSESLNPTSYVARLRTIQSNAAGGLISTVFRQKKGAYTPAEIADFTTAAFDLDIVSSPNDAEKLQLYLIGGGYTPEQATKAITTLLQKK